MKFDPGAAVLVLRRTPDTLDTWLRGLPADWTGRNEGGDHDLAHIQQIARVMAKQYKEEIGPWKEYIPVLRR